MGKRAIEGKSHTTCRPPYIHVFMYIRNVDEIFLYYNTRYSMHDIQIYLCQQNWLYNHYYIMWGKSWFDRNAYTNNVLTRNFFSLFLSIEGFHLSMVLIYCMPSTFTNDWYWGPLLSTLPNLCGNTYVLKLDCLTCKDCHYIHIRH